MGIPPGDPAPAEGRHPGGRTCPMVIVKPVLFLLAFILLIIEV